MDTAIVFWPFNVVRPFYAAREQWWRYLHKWGSESREAGLGAERQP